MTGPTRGEPIRLFLLDDHEIVRRGLRDLFESEPDIEVVGEAGSASDAVTQLLATRPDVALLDARLPDGSGVDVCRTARSHLPDLRTLILTSYEDDEAVFAAIMAGAAGYVLKQVSGPELVAAVRQVAAGQSLLDAAATTQVLDRLRHHRSPGDLYRLSDREHEVLVLVAQGLTNRQIAERLFLSDKTVKNHVSNLLGKLGLERRTQAARLAAKLGI